MEGFTNKEIAAASGIRSPGLIYHYFENKRDQFRAVIEAHVLLLHLVLQHSEECRLLPPTKALRAFGIGYLRGFEDPGTAALLKIIFGESSRDPATALMFAEIRPARALRFLAEYLEEQMERGVIGRPI